MEQTSEARLREALERLMDTLDGLRKRNPHHFRMSAYAIELVTGLAPFGRCQRLCV